MSSSILMPSFAGDAPMVRRVLRGQGFFVDLYEPLIEVAIDKHITMTVGTYRDGYIYEMRAWAGSPIQAGAPIAIIGDGSGNNLVNAVFIAYRRSDSSGYTGRIYDGIVKDIGRHQVFRDLGSLKPGRDFVAQVAAALQSARIMVVVIGPGWLNAVDHRQRPRLEDPTDLHRVEIRSALDNAIPIVPVLVGGAPMPRPDQLPDDIRGLVQHHAIEISDQRWNTTRRFSVTQFPSCYLSIGSVATTNNRAPENIAISDCVLHGPRLRMRPGRSSPDASLDDGAVGGGCRCVPTRKRNEPLNSIVR